MFETILLGGQPEKFDGSGDLLLVEGGWTLFPERFSKLVSSYESLRLCILDCMQDSSV